MPSSPDDLNRAKKRLLATTPFIAAGAVASVLAAVAAADPSGITATGLTVATALQTLASLAGNIAATDIHKILSERVLSVDVLKGGDLARAVRVAICTVIREASQEVTDRNERNALEKIASVDEDGWTEAEATLWLRESVEGLSDDSVVDMFSKTPEEFAALPTLNLDGWRSVVGGLAGVSAVALEGDPITSPGTPKLSVETVDFLSSRLQETFPLALYEILKEDFAGDGKAYGGLLMRLVGSISARQVETIQAAYDILGETGRILATVERTEGKVDEVLQKLESLQPRAAPATPTRLAINMPPRNRIFTGRRDVLDTLKSELMRSQTVSLSGLPGVGKTQTTVEYAHEQYDAGTYDYVLFVRSATEAELLRDFRRAAHALDLPAKVNADVSLVALAVKVWLERTGKWLLVFDNGNDLRMLLPHLPSNPTGHIIFTRLTDDAVGVAHNIKVEKMRVDEGALLLLRRAGLTTESDTLAEVTTEVAEQARAVARETDGLPLSLAIAGAFIKETSTGPDQYLTLYRTQGQQLRREQDRNATYEHSVATAFSLAFEQLATPEEDTEQGILIASAAANLLRLCSFFAPNAIPLEWVLENVTALGEDMQQALENILWRKRVVARATRFALLEAKLLAGAYDMHREVQSVLRDEMDDETKRLWAGRALQALAAIIPDAADFTDRERCDLLLPHILVCLEYGDGLGIETETVGRLKNHVGLHLSNNARYPEAESMLEQALNLRRKLLGPEHTDMAQSMTNLADVYKEQGRYEEAGSLAKQALELWTRLTGPDDPHVALAMNNLGTVYEAQGRYTEAEPLYEQALEIFKQSTEPEHRFVAVSMHNVAQVYRARGRYGDAKPLYEGALELAERTLGPEHPYVAAFMDSLAGWHRKQHSYEEAERLYRQALALRKTLLGPEHPDVALSLNNLGVLYRDLNRYSEVVELSEQALEVWEKSFGPEHPHCASSLDNIATAYQRLGDYDEAERLFERALRLKETSLGSEHPLVALGMHNLAVLYHERRRYEEAEHLFERALDILDRKLGKDHPDTIHVRGNFELFKRD